MSEIPQSVIVHPVEKFGGTIEVPGDKSISHRIAMLAGIASGETTVRNSSPINRRKASTIDHGSTAVFGHRSLARRAIRRCSSVCIQ